MQMGMYVFRILIPSTNTGRSEIPTRVPLITTN